MKRKVFKKLQYFPTDELIQEIIECKYLAVETLLISLKRILQIAEVEKPVVKINKPLPESTSRSKSRPKIASKEKTRKVSSEEESEPLHVRQIRELKNAIKNMEVKIEELGGVVVQKNEHIKHLQNRL